MNRLFSRLRLPVLAIAGVMLPAVALSVIQYRSLAELEQKTEAAIRENMRRTLQNATRRTADRVKLLAEESMVSADPLDDDPNSLHKVEKRLSAAKASRPEIDQLFVVSCNSCENKFALYSSSNGIRKVGETDFENDMYTRSLLDSHQKSFPHYDPAEAKRDYLFVQSDMCYGSPSQYDMRFQSTVLYPLFGPDGKTQTGFAGMTLNTDYIKQSLLPELFRDALAADANEAGTDTVLGVFDEKGNLIYASREGVTDFEVAASFEPVFPKWRIAAGYGAQSIQALAKDNFRKSLLLTAFVLSVLVFGAAMMLRAASREMRLAQAKSDFVSNVSHELKTPLALIRLFAESLELGRVQSPEKAENYYKIIGNESRRLTQLINNILDFSKIEAGRKEYCFIECDAAAVVDEVLEGYKYHLLNSGFELSVNIDRNLPRVQIDRDAISQALLNLLDNAVKYSGGDKKISVWMGLRDRFIAIEVSDNGIGIPSSEHEKIFEKFYRVGSSLVHDAKGTGLGLAMVKHIAEAHRGRITVESAVGKGSRFTILLRIADCGLRIEESLSLPDPQSVAQNQKLNNPQSAIRNPQSIREV